MTDDASDQNAEARKPAPPPDDRAADPPAVPETVPETLPETGGPKGPEPTRYGDWERKGRCIDF